MKHNKRLLRIIAIVLAVLLAGGVVFGALFGALSEEQNSVGKGAQSQCALEMEYLDDEQALRITQRLVYINPSSGRLKDVVFYATGNMFRRQDGLLNLVQRLLFFRNPPLLFHRETAVPQL